MKTDPLLMPFFATPNDREGERYFDQLWARDLQPIVRRMLLNKGVPTSDTEDLTQEIGLRLWSDLAAKRQEGKYHIGNIHAYTRAIVAHLCIDWLRKQNSRYRHLGQAVRDLLNEGKLLTRWTSGEVEWCGPRDRVHETFVFTEEYAAFLEGDYSDFQAQQLQHASPREVAGSEWETLNVLIAHLFTWLKTPLTLQQLICHLGQLLEIGEQTPLSLEELEETGIVGIPDPNANILETVLHAETLYEIGEFIRNKHLNRCESAALLLRFHREFIVGQLLLSPAEVADILEFPSRVPEKFRAFREEIWHCLPFESDEAIAEVLGIDEPALKKRLQRVSNCRMTAHRKMGHWIHRRWQDAD